MRALKIIVVVMGVMIIAGFVALVAIIAGRVSRGGPAATAARALSGRPIELPRGARIEAMTAGPDRLVLGLELPQGDRQLLIIDLRTGARLGTIELHQSP
ncbi:MAG TPA: DUF6476 family protein [Stellaceae bacterium]|jgi:hypothetical protein|nr:DUF6476 family protein [Stellaceae bacterium]